MPVPLSSRLTVSRQGRREVASAPRPPDYKLNKLRASRIIKGVPHYEARRYSGPAFGPVRKVAGKRRGERFVNPASAIRTTGTRGVLETMSVMRDVARAVISFAGLPYPVRGRTRVTWGTDPPERAFPMKVPAATSRALAILLPST